MRLVFPFESTIFLPFPSWKSDKLKSSTTKTTSPAARSMLADSGNRSAIPPPSFLSQPTMETSSLIQKELLELSPQTDAAASASFNETDPIDETLTLFELFLIKIQSKKYGDALQIASEILKTDPRNPLILEYVPLLKEKMMLDLKEAEEEDEEGDSDEDEDEDSDDDDNDDEDIDTSDDSENDSDDSDSDDTDLSEEDELNTSGGQ